MTEVEEVDGKMKEYQSGASQRQFFNRQSFRKMLRRKSGPDSASRSSKDIPQDDVATKIQPSVSDSISEDVQNVVVKDNKPILEKQDSVHDEDDVITSDVAVSRAETSREEESEGINDSITNMSLFTNFVYSFVSNVSRQLWILLRSTVTFVVNVVTSSGEQVVRERRQSERAGVQTDGGETSGDKVDTTDDATQRRLFNIANELMTTEEQYVKRLGVLVILKTQTSSILQADVAKAMFQNIEVIHQFHHDNLLPELHMRIENWDTIKKIGDIMKKLTPFLKLYTEYVKNYESANNLLISWRQKNSAFEKLMKDAENNAAYGRLKVQAHMLEPIQRVPRYELLLRDYLRKLPEDSPDREDSQKALTLVAEAASHFEEMMKRDSRILELMQLQNQFEGGVSIVQSQRELKHKGKVRAISTRTGKISDKVIHLFNDMLLVSSEIWNITGGDRYKVKYNFNLQYTRIGFALNLEVNHAFYLSSKRTVVEIVAGDNEERLEWMERIDKEIRTCAEKNNTPHPGIPERNYIYEYQWCKRKQVLQLSADGGKAWKRRTLAVYDNGLMCCFKSHSDKTPMSVVFLCDYHVTLGSIPQKKGKVCTLVGEGKTYHLYDDNPNLVERFFEDASPFQLSVEEEIIAQEFTAASKEKSPDAVSIDSGIDIQNARLSGLSMDSETAWARASVENDVNNDSDVIKETASLGDHPGQRISGLSTDSGFTDVLKEEVTHDEEPKDEESSSVALPQTEGTEC